MAKDTDEMANALAGNIRRQIVTPANRRQLGRLPMFKVDFDLPRELSALLADLDAASGRRERTEARKR